MRDILGGTRAWGIAGQAFKMTPLLVHSRPRQATVVSPVARDLLPVRITSCMAHHSQHTRVLLQPLPCCIPTWLSASWASLPRANAAISRKAVSGADSMRIRGGMAPRWAMRDLYAAGADREEEEATGHQMENDARTKVRT